MKQAKSTRLPCCRRTLFQKCLPSRPSQSVEMCGFLAFIASIAAMPEMNVHTARS